ncbi:uncharacterized protein LOC119373624 isoform X2 [Rhipicephalus sanguineus]|nr:uncharacterized protein LOC119373624 isoform X2 [Rhipicephalus sanguineus]
MKLKSVLLANILFVVSTTLAGPCPRPTCGSGEQPPICPSQSSSCGCRCSNSGSTQPSPPSAAPWPPTTAPCGSGTGATQVVPPTVGVNGGCSKPPCSSEEKMTCLDKAMFGGGCHCKCIKWSDNCTMPWGPYECMHVCENCMCRCVAEAPFRKPEKPPCKPIIVRQ